MEGPMRGVVVSVCYIHVFGSGTEASAPHMHTSAPHTHASGWCMEASGLGLQRSP